MDYRKSRNALLGETAVKAFERKYFEAYYCETKEETVKKALSLIPEGSLVTWGGSMSVSECGLTEALKNGNYNVLDRNILPPEEKANAMQRAFTADTFLMSANAASLDGCLVNIDGTGNRLAALCYGPKQVIVIIGLNKLVKTQEQALMRARNEAAPLNTQRFDINTPCRITGACADCISPDCICAQILTTRICRPAKRIKIIFCGDSLGF